MTKETAVKFQFRLDSSAASTLAVLAQRFGRRDVADGLQQPAIGEPVKPFERGERDGLE